MVDKKQVILTYCSRNIMLTSLVLIGTIAFLNWFVSPHRNNLLAAQRYESVTTDLVKKKQTIDNTMTTKQNKFKELHSKLEQTHTKFFGLTEAREFFNNIQTMVRNANCTVNLLKFSPTDSAIKAGKSGENSCIITQQAKLSVIGSYRNITLLMNRLQNRSEQVQIGAVTVESTKNKSGQLKCDMNITIYVIQNKEICIND